MKQFIPFSFILSIALFLSTAARADLSVGLVAHYPFDGSADDQSGNGNHGAPHGPVSAVDRFGCANRAYQFDGEDDFIEIVDTNAMDFGTGPFSISVWITTDAVTGSGIARDDILAKGDPTINGFSLSMQGNSAVFMNGGSPELSANEAINDNQWHHVVGVRETNHAVAIYVDGQTANTGLNSENVTVTSDLIIGRHGVHESESFFKGSMDDIRIYNRALTADEVSTLYASHNVKWDIIPDGYINLKDVIAALQITAGDNLPLINLSADMNGDLRIGLPEAIYVLQCIGGLYNTAPVLDPIGDQEILENTPLSFSVSAYDLDGDELVYSVINLPQGAIFNPDTHEFSWTPTFTQSGVYHVTFVVHDLYRSESETITITVEDVPLFIAPDYFPLSVGNYWDYRDEGTGKVERLRVSGTKTVHGIVTQIVQSPSGEKGYYTSDSNGVRFHGGYMKSDEYTGDIIYDTPLLLAPNNAPLGSTWTSSTHAYITIFVPGYGDVGVDFYFSSNGTFVDVEDVVTQNRTLPGCIKTSSEDTYYCPQTGETTTETTYTWLYKGVGEVKSSNGDHSIITESYVNGVRQTY